MKKKKFVNMKWLTKFAYWIEKGKLEKDKFEKVQLVGKQKEKNWHFGFQAQGNYILSMF